MCQRPKDLVLEGLSITVRAKPVPTQQPLVNIDLNAPPPEDNSEAENHFGLESRSIRIRAEDHYSGDDEDADDSDEDEEFLDVDNMSYEELLALGERIGTQNRGLPQDVISALPCHMFAQTVREGECNRCVICCYNFEDGVSLLTLPCKHLYHRECIESWLHIRKNCPICNTEVMPSEYCQV
ncbi:hypothetical protein GOP47_0009340 [Adiantum capillus-veneris]|uniref:RING-type domain-containing protein n=1 Tax=Adiantum capillus-veneris TaxID=13818 RepID=A0A9D4ZH46_ADICA|nr:hypothetical protein GOP47_0009340 [Adiantum capillus-veneris]